jgi:hypothetical protein
MKVTRGLGLASLVVSSRSPECCSRPSSTAGGRRLQARTRAAAYQAQAGTFVGATVTDVSGVTLLHAEPTTFCLRIVSNSGVLYDGGPGGMPSPQRC